MVVNIQRTLAVAGAVLFCATMLFGASATGTWKGSLTAPDGGHDLTFKLTASGDKLTGTVSDAASGSGELEIREGKIEGDTITFQMLYPYQGDTMKILYKGQVTADEIRFNIATDDGSWSTDFVAKRTS
jgi:hypothetical protein